MQQPDWFILIHRWCDCKMGRYGVGLPFLVGAIVAKKQNRIPVFNDAQCIVQDMIDNPVDSFVVEVTWCANIAIPVFRVTPEDSKERVTFRTVEVANPDTRRTALVFDCDLTNKWGQLPETLLSALVQDATPPIIAGTFSRHGRDWGKFSEEETQFIEREIMGSPQLSPSAK